MPINLRLRLTSGSHRAPWAKAKTCPVSNNKTLFALTSQTCLISSLSNIILFSEFFLKDLFFIEKNAIRLECCPCSFLLTETLQVFDRIYFVKDRHSRAQNQQIIRSMYTSSNMIKFSK